MGRLIYSAITSLDGYIEDESGNFDWAEPDDEVHRFVNEMELPISTYLYGRRMYETMAVWETFGTASGEPDVIRDFHEIWRAANKIVFSKTLADAPTAKTRIERNFDPEAIRQLKISAPTDISIGGPDLAAHAIRAGLVDEYHFFVGPVVVGGGKPSLPNNTRFNLELLDERRFANGVVHLHYRTSPNH